jgi:hypothetical protein
MDSNCPTAIFEAWEKEIATIEKAKAKFGDEIEPGKFSL